MAGSACVGENESEDMVFAGGADLPREDLDLDDEVSADDIALFAAAEPDDPAMSNASAALAVAA